MKNPFEHRGLMFHEAECGDRILQHTPGAQRAYYQDYGSRYPKVPTREAAADLIIDIHMKSEHTMGADC